MKTNRQKRLSIALITLMAMLFASPVSSFAQDPVLPPQTEHQYNDDIHSFIIKRLRQTPSNAKNR
jgi:hypothetical protein